MLGKATNMVTEGPKRLHKESDICASLIINMQVTD